MSKLADNLNAEIVLGTIPNRDEAVQWFGYTHLCVRAIFHLVSLQTDMMHMLSIGVFACLKLQPYTVSVLINDHQEDDGGFV